MTCIIGVLNEKEDAVYIGADSLGANWCQQLVFKNRKVFKAKDNANLLMGICGDYKLQNILSVEDNLIDEVKHLKNEVDFSYFIQHTTPRIMELAKKYECVTTKSGYANLEGSIIIGYKNQLYIIESNGQVLEPEDGYIADGSGGSFALAVLSQNGDKDIVDRIREGLEAAEKHAVGVKRPFYIMNTLNDDVVTIK